MNYKVTRRAFGIQLAILCATFVALNIVMWRFSNGRPVQLARRIAFQGPVNTLFIGNSLVEAGIVTSAYAAGCGVPDDSQILNAGLGATGPVEYLMVFRDVVRHDTSLDTVIIGTYDTQVTDTIPEHSDLQGNATFAYLNEPAVSASYYTNNAFERSLFLLNAKVPYLSQRGTLWQRVELLRRRLEAIGSGHKQQNNAFGRQSDFTALEAANTDSFDLECNRVVTQGLPLSKPIADLLQLARSRAGQVVVVEMPMPGRHRKLFYSSAAWAAYQRYKEQLIERAGATYIDASAYLTDEADFQDVLHMNHAGALLFSRRLGEEIRKLKSNGQHVDSLPR